MTRRIVSIWLPRLGAERLLRRAGPLAAPFATVAEAGGALRLASLSAAAEGAGLARGMGLADARAIRPDLVTRPADPPAEAAFLGALVRWAGRYSPWVAADGPEGLALDVTGCAHLFGGEAALLEDALARLGAMGLSARAACADTRGAAWALARFAAGDGAQAGAVPAEGRPPGGTDPHPTRPGVAGAAPATPTRPCAPRADGARGSGGRRPADSGQPGPSGPPSPPAQARRGPPPDGDRRAAAGAPTEQDRGKAARAGWDRAPGPAPLARGPSGAPAGRDGDAIAADARATRVRSPARPAWEKRRALPPMAAVVAPPGGARAAIGPLPAAALRLDPATVEGLARLGLRTVADLAALPRGGLARRFGAATLRRLDQALGAEPEPVGAGRPAPVFAARLSLPEPVGRVADVAAALDRLLAQVTARLAEHGRGARRLRLVLRRVDGADLVVEVGLARPSRDARMIAELFARPVEGLDAGFGIEALRLEAVETEPLSPLQHRGHLAAGAEAAARAAPGGGEAFGALLSRLGGRIGFERLERFLPADSHIPARAFTVASAAFAEAHAGPWPRPPGPRPLVLFDPEPVDPEPPEPGPGAAGPRPPAAFRWRGRAHRVACAFGPERIAPEWWLDDPAWRTGPRDYWRVETADGARLWLFHAPLSHRTDRWFMEGAFG